MSNAVNRTFMMNKKSLTCIIATLLGGTICAGNRYVSYLTGNDGDGKSWANAKTSISAAIFDVGVGDTMFIAEGPYYESISVQDGATYLGGYNAETGERDVNLYETTIIGSGDDSYLIVKYDAAPENHILIDGITIPYGSMSSFGAPVYLRGNMTLNNCLIRHCSGAQAGAIYLEQGEATVQGVVSNCIIEFCTSTDYAGAIYNDGGIVENCIIRGCQGKYSGIYNRTNGIIQNCVLYNNSGNVASSRGCIYCLGGQVINCTVCNNYGTQYSGIYLSQGQVVNCVFWGNQSEEGFTNPPNYISSSSDSHHNITDNGTSADAFLSITLNIENNAADGPNFVNPTTFVGVHTNVEDSIAMISADFSLTAASTALLSQADASLAPSTDIIGIQRPQGAGVDIGTYEFTGEENPSGCTIASGKCGADADSANVTWVLGCDSVLIISGTGAMMDNNNNSMFNPGGETNPQWAPARTSRNAKMMGVETPWTDYRYAVKIVRIEEGVTHVGDDAFSDCPNITQVSMPESLTSIGSYAFAYASRMHSVTIPTNVTEIEDKAFYNCTNLDTIYCNNPVPATIASTTFTTQSTSVLIVPASSVEQYKAASYWSTFANIQSKDNIPSTDFSVSYIFVGETATLSGNIQLNELGHIAYKDKADNGVASWKINVTRECNVKVTITMEAGSSSGHQFVVDVLDANQEVIAELTQPSKGFGDSSIELPDSIAFITPGVYTIRLSNLTEWSAAIVEGVIFTAITPSSNPCIIASGKCGTVGDSTNVVWELSCDSVLTISGEGSISRKYFSPYIQAIKHVVINEGVTSIPSSVFYNCSTMVSVVIPTTVKTIGLSAFENCYSLTSVTIPDGVTQIDMWAFRSCTSLSSLYISASLSQLNTNRSFDNCVALTSIIVDPENPVYDSRNNCNAIIKTSTNTLVVGCKTTIIPEDVTSIGDWAFCRCKGLSSINIPNSVTSIREYAFDDCTGLTSITIPSSVTEIGSAAFEGCEGLTAIYISDISAWCNIAFSDNPLNIAKHLYLNGELVVNLVIPEDVTTINYHAFNGCADLASIYIPGSVTSMGNEVFSNCPNLGSITISADNTTYDSRNNCNAIIETATNTLVLGCKNSTVPYGVTSIGMRAFSGCNGLNSIELPYGVTSIGESAFLSCYDITTIVLPRTISDIGEDAFFFCSNLDTLVCKATTPPTLGLDAFRAGSNKLHIYVPGQSVAIYQAAERWSSYASKISAMPCMSESGTCGVNGDNLTWVLDCDSVLTIRGEGEMPSSYSGTSAPWYEYGAAIKHINIEEGVTKLALNAFYNSGNNYPNVQTLSIPSTLGAPIENNFFYQCPLKTITINSDTIIGKASYSSGSSLQNKFGAQVEEYIFGGSVRSIANFAFYNQSPDSLRSIILPEGLEAIGNWAFGYIEHLTSVSIPSTVQTIGTDAFAYCSNLRSVELGEGLMTVNGQAFWMCDSLTRVTCNALTPPTLNQTAFDHNLSDTLFIPCEAKTAYQEADYWKNFGKIMCANDTIGGNTEPDVPEEYTFTLDANWQFIMLPTVFGLTQDDIVVDGEIEWGIYNSAQRASGRSGWQGFTPQNGFEGSQAYIVRARNGSATLTINIPDQAREQAAVTMPISYHPATHEQNANWNFLGNPYPYSYDILSALEEADIESPVTIWNGTGYDLFTPGIDLKTLDPFEAFFIQLPDGGSEVLPLSPEHIKDTSDSGNNGNSVADADGALPGYFTINTSKEKVRFSRGNLQYQASTATWQFAENQYDVIGEGNVNISATYDGWIDLFGWGTGDNPTKASTSKCDYSGFVDWGINAISNGGNTADMWRTLSANEWTYITGQRTNYESLCGRATVNGIQGFILLPDDWVSPGIPFQGSKDNGYELNQFSLEDWQKMEAAGAVFLPACGGRTGTEMTSTAVQYWSTNEGSSCYAYDIITNGDTAYRLKTNQVERSSAFGVRLVK